MSYKSVLQRCVPESIKPQDNSSGPTVIGDPAGIPYHVNPMNVCTELYGYENVNEVRSCVMNNIYRLTGPLCANHTAGLQDTINRYLIQMLEQAGKNPRAVKLALPPSHLQPRFFFDLYEKYRDVNKAYRESLTYCGTNENYKLQCYVDARSVQK
jgi:hypothetical protein